MHLEGVGVIYGDIDSIEIACTGSAGLSGVVKEMKTASSRRADVGMLQTRLMRFAESFRTSGA